MRIVVAAFGFLVAAAIACSDSDSTSSPPPDPCANSGASATINATDNYAFTPNPVTITVGQSVCWQNTGALMHTVTESVGRFNGSLPSGQTFVYTFGFGGSFFYHCTQHSNMSGTI